MPRFLIDANLPYRFGLWHGPDFVHLHDLGEDWPDQKVWEYAQTSDLVIVTKDSDFAHWVMLSDPSPRVIRFRIGNMRLRDFHAFANTIWPRLVGLSSDHKLVIVTRAQIEAIS